MRQIAFQALVRQALQRIPQQFREALDNCEIVIEDWPDPKLMEEMFGEASSQAYGLFVGVPLPQRDASSWGLAPALIYIYKGPLLADFPQREELSRQVEITLIHEIAHFLGFDEETLERYGYD